MSKERIELANTSYPNTRMTLDFDRRCVNCNRYIIARVNSFSTWQLSNNVWKLLTTIIFNGRNTEYPGEFFFEHSFVIIKVLNAEH
jgi:hypothetical protein